MAAALMPPLRRDLGVCYPRSAVGAWARRTDPAMSYQSILLRLHVHGWAHGRDFDVRAEPEFGSSCWRSPFRRPRSFHPDVECVHEFRYLMALRLHARLG